VLQELTVWCCPWSSGNTAGSTPIGKHGGNSLRSLGHPGQWEVVQQLTEVLYLNPTPAQDSSAPLVPTAIIRSCSRATVSLKAGKGLVGLHQVVSCTETCSGTPPDPRTLDVTYCSCSVLFPALVHPFWLLTARTEHIPLDYQCLENRINNSHYHWKCFSVLVVIYSQPIIETPAVFLSTITFNSRFVVGIVISDP